MNNYILSVDADVDLDDIWEYIAADSVDAADRWIGKLFDAFEALGHTPGMGHRRGGLDRSFGLVLAGWRVPHHLPRRATPYRNCGRDAGFPRYPVFPNP